jgi:predicted RecB family nuclease
MKQFGTTLQISASDLANHLACRHITTLDLLAARGEIDREFREDPRIDALIERGRRHEAEYIAQQKSAGLTVLENDPDNASVQRTIDAMKSGVDVIVQAALSDGKWWGRADVLQKVDVPSELGNWSYEVVDTKLARNTKGGTILQLCLYSEMLAALQGHTPDLARFIAHYVRESANFESASLSSILHSGGRYMFFVDLY